MCPHLSSRVRLLITLTWPPSSTQRAACWALGAQHGVNLVPNWLYFVPNEPEEICSLFLGFILVYLGSPFDSKWVPYGRPGHIVQNLVFSMGARWGVKRGFHPQVPPLGKLCVLQRVLKCSLWCSRLPRSPLTCKTFSQTLLTAQVLHVYSAECFPKSTDRSLSL